MADTIETTTPIEEESTTPVYSENTTTAEIATPTDIVLEFDSSSLRGHSIILSLANDDGSSMELTTNDDTVQTVELVTYSERYYVFYVTNVLIDYEGTQTLTFKYGKNQAYTFSFQIHWSPNFVSSDVGSFQFLNDETIYLNGNETSYKLSYLSFDCTNLKVYSDSNLASINNNDNEFVYDIELTNNNNGASNRTFNISALGYSYSSKSLVELTDSLTVVQYPYNYYYFNLDEYQAQYSTHEYLIATIPATEISYSFTFTSNAPIIWFKDTVNCTVSLDYDLETSNQGTITVAFGDENTGAARTGSFIIGIDDGSDLYYLYLIQQKVTSDGYIAATTTNNVLSYNDTSEHTLTFTATNCVEDNYSYSTDSEWITLNSLSVSSGSGTIKYQLSENEINEERTGTIYITGQSTGGAYTTTSINITQLSTLTPIDFPIWKDTDVTISSDEDYVLYNIVYNNETIYNGRAFSIDGSATIRVNDILRNFIDERIDLTKQYQVQSNNSHYTFIFNVQQSEGLYYPYVQLRTWNDNSYDDSVSYEPKYISQYIDFNVDKRQLFLVSVEDFYTNEDTSLNIAGIFTPIAGIAESSVFNRTVSINNDVATYVVPTSNFTSTISTTLNSSNSYTFTLVDSCKPYCLYWRNIYGGYNYCLFNDASKQTDSITNYDYSTESSNTTINFYKKQYLKEITESWNIKTDYLNDAQSNIIKYIPHSPEVYLHDLVNDKIIPVLVTDTSVEHKLYRNNSRKFITYNFKVENSHTKLIQ